MKKALLSEWSISNYKQESCGYIQDEANIEWLCPCILGVNHFKQWKQQTGPSNRPNFAYNQEVRRYIRYGSALGEDINFLTGCINFTDYSKARRKLKLEMRSLLSAGMF